MNKNYTYFIDLCEEIGEIPTNGIISRTLYSDDQLKVILFGFDQGQELSEHTSTMPAIIHIVRGEARLTLGDYPKEAKAGSWVHMPPQLKHSVYAKTPLVMLLILVKSIEQKV
ncbi:MAG TPA: cupin domain-containing protein [Thermodesulfobacteriota bacterium]|nr:cupin domain-containing protein [Thermodesulfobacteriota bacterium]